MLRIPFWQGWRWVIGLGVVVNTILILVALALSNVPKSNAIPLWLSWVVWGFAAWAVLSTLRRFVIAQRVVAIDPATKMAEISGISSRTQWVDLGVFSGVSSRECRWRSLLWVSVHLRSPDGQVEIARFSELWNEDAAHAGAKELRSSLSQMFGVRDEGVLNY